MKNILCLFFFALTAQASDHVGIAVRAATEYVTIEQGMMTKNPQYTAQLNAIVAVLNSLKTVEGGIGCRSGVRSYINYGEGNLLHICSYQAFASLKFEERVQVVLHSAILLAGERDLCRASKIEELIMLNGSYMVDGAYSSMCK